MKYYKSTWLENLMLSIQNNLIHEFKRSCIWPNAWTTLVRTKNNQSLFLTDACWVCSVTFREDDFLSIFQESNWTIFHKILWNNLFVQRVKVQLSSMDCICQKELFHHWRHFLSADLFLARNKTLCHRNRCNNGLRREDNLRFNCETIIGMKMVA